MFFALLNRLFGPRVATRVTPWLVLFALSFSCYWLVGLFGEHSKIKDWLFWRYAGVWAYTLAFALACFSAGNWLVHRLSEPELVAEPEQRAGLEHFVLAFSTGVFAFFLVTAAVGFAHGFGRLSFALIPLVLFAVGARQLWRDVVRLRAKARADVNWLKLSPLEVAAFAVGAIALAVIYLGVLVPENAAYDARWYHLGLAENYRAAGGIIRSVEGSAASTVPHLASILYTWAYCLPWGLFERIELCAHLEFVIFVMTLPGLVALVRYFVPDSKARGAWLALFTFPSIFLYDTSLHIAADHIAALWTIPVYLTFVRAFKSLSVKACLLFAIQVSAILLTKYTALIAVAGPILALVLRGLWLSGAQLRHTPRRPRALGSLFVTLLAGLILTTPHWLKNLVWHGDPVYPILHKYLPVRPWTGQSSYIFSVYQSHAWAAEGTASEKLKGAIHALWDYSYKLYNFAEFHGIYPVFGSLFTACLVALPFLRGTRRFWSIVVMIHFGIALWFWLFHSERYLQALLPWMAAVVAGLAILAWRAGWAARLGVVLVGGVQIVWGLDMPFWPLHRMTFKSQIALANDFFAKGYGEKGADRRKPFEEYAALGRQLPRQAKVLLHHDHMRTGLGAMTVSDAVRIQYGINYAELGSARAVDRLLRDFGVTHLLWQPKMVFGNESLGGDLVFHAYAADLQIMAQYGSRAVAKVGTSLPREVGADALVYLCNPGGYLPGIYPIKELATSPYGLPGEVKRYPGPRMPFAAVPEEWPLSVGYAVVSSACPGAPTVRGFIETASFSSARYYVRSAN